LWTQHFYETGSATELRHSDSFLKAHEIAVLFDGPEVAAVSCLTWFDLRLTAHRHASQFELFPDSLLTSFAAQGHHRVFNAGYLAMPVEKRGSFTGLPLKHLFFSMLVRRFVSSDATLALGIGRSDKGMTRLCTSVGGESLGSATLHNTPVDIISIPADRARIALGMLANEQTEQLWANRQACAGTDPSKFRRATDAAVLRSEHSLNYRPG
jgi:hypothetical protein